jgi:hypothetical protein
MLMNMQRSRTLPLALAFSTSLLVPLIGAELMGTKQAKAQGVTSSPGIVVGINDPVYGQQNVVTDPFNLQALTSQAAFTTAIPAVGAALGYPPAAACSQQACLGYFSDWITTENQFTVNLAQLAPSEIASQTGQGSLTTSLANWGFLADVTPQVLGDAIANLKPSSLSEVPVLAAAASSLGIAPSSTVEEALQNQTFASSTLSALGVNLNDFAAQDLGNFFETPLDAYKDLALAKDVFKDFPIDSILGLATVPISVSFVAVPMRVDVTWGEAEQAGIPQNPKAQALHIAGWASEAGNTGRVPCGDGLNGPSEPCPYAELTSFDDNGIVSALPIGSRWGASYIKNGTLIGAVDGGYGPLKPVARIFGKVQEYRGINLSRFTKMVVHECVEKDGTCDMGLAFPVACAKIPFTNQWTCTAMTLNLPLTFGGVGLKAIETKTILVPLG